MLCLLNKQQIYNNFILLNASKIISSDYVIEETKYINFIILYQQILKKCFLS